MDLDLKKPMGVDPITAMLAQCLGAAASVSAIAMLYHLYRWASQYKRAPGQLQLFNSLFVRDSELTNAGVEHKKRFWFFWRFFAISLISTMALGLVSAKSVNAG
ncbi:hypothetical protein [Hydrocarboniphaga sp.]|uniref:hypothetical protein n=1 Tax=Hydrocarboniphaga sp. TaxID=2033016 RepID=UPI003D0C31FC